MVNEDPTKYRTTLICACNGDLAEGYGPSAEASRLRAIAIFRKAHGKAATWSEEVLEWAVPNGPGSTDSHYEEV